MSKIPNKPKDQEGTKKILTNLRREAIRNTTDKVDNNG